MYIIRNTTNLFLHLIPGILIGIIYYILSSLSFLSAIPRYNILGFAGLIILLPFIILVFRTFDSKECNSATIPVLNKKTKPMNTILYSLSLFLLVGAIMSLMNPVTSYFQNIFAQWLPNSFFLTEDFTIYSQRTIIITIIFSSITIGVILPILEEIYFRGFLLPRMKKQSATGVLYHSILFALYHTWSPWMIFARTIALFPLFYGVSKKQSLMIAIIVHICANMIDFILLTQYL